MRAVRCAGLLVVVFVLAGCPQQQQQVAHGTRAVLTASQTLLDHAETIKETNPERTLEIAKIVVDFDRAALKAGEINLRAMCTDNPTQDGCEGIVPFIDKEMADRKLAVAFLILQEAETALLKEYGQMEINL